MANKIRPGRITAIPNTNVVGSGTYARQQSTTNKSKTKISPQSGSGSRQTTEQDKRMRG